MNKKILFIINVDRFFVSHFLPFGLECIKKGYETHIACSITNQKDYLASLGFIIHPLLVSRSGMNIKKEFSAIIEVYKTIKSINPHILEFFSIKPILYGGITSKFLQIPKKVFYITGLGYVFTAKGLYGFIVRSIIKMLYMISINGKSSSVITENINDKILINKLMIGNTNQITIIRGAGADLNKYKYIKENNTNIKISMACRLLRDKGVFEFVEAAKILKEKFPNIEFNLYGDIDIHNPASLTSNDVEKIKNEKNIKVHGFTNDIATVFSDANIVVLPSYREGLPKVLVEAAACGRAVVTTDVPGCRDAITPNVTGLLCKVKDPKSLSDAIEKLIKDDKLRNRMGIEGRKLAEKEFDINMIVRKHFEVYETR